MKSDNIFRKGHQLDTRNSILFSRSEVESAGHRIEAVDGQNFGPVNVRRNLGKLKEPHFLDI